MRKMCLIFLRENTGEGNHCRKPEEKKTLRGNTPEKNSFEAEKLLKTILYRGNIRNGKILLKRVNILMGIFYMRKYLKERGHSELKIFCKRNNGPGKKESVREKMKNVLCCRLFQQGRNRLAD